MKVITFYLCNCLFGIDITLVKEINRNVEYTQVPDSQPHIVGLFNMRGQIVTLFDLARLMGLDAGDAVTRPACIILKGSPNDPNQLGFLIDKAGDVIDIGLDMCEPSPANVGGVEGEFINSVVKLKDELLMIIQPEKVFDI